MCDVYVYLWALGACGDREQLFEVASFMPLCEIWGN